MASPPPRWLVGVALAAGAAGIFLRFSNLPLKLFWLDETWTSLRIAGFTQADVQKALYDGRVVGRDDLLRYQRVTPGHGLAASAFVHVGDDPYHPPVYYVLARAWAGLVGDEPGPLRALSAVFGLLTVGAAFVLARETFASTSAGLVAGSLFAVSPFHVLYSQEARPYELLSLAVLLSGIAFLRALRTSTATTWLVYAVSLVFGMYTSVLFLLVPFAHAVFLAVSFRALRREAKRAAPVWLAAGFLFLPWLAVLFRNRGAALTNGGWIGTRIPADKLVAGLLDSLVTPFADAPESPGHAFRGASLAVLLLAIWSMLRIGRASNADARRGAVFTICLVLAPLGALAFSDVVIGGIRTLYPRFMAPALVGLSIAVAGAVAAVLDATGARGLAGKALFALLIGLGVAGSWQSNRSPCWWNSFRCAETLDAAALVNAGPRPVFIAHSDWWIPNALSFSRLLDPKVRIQLVSGGTTPSIPADASDVFVATHTDPRARTDGAFASWRLEPALSFWLFRRVD